MIRWKGIIFLLILAAIMVLLSFIFTDRWLETRLESNGSSVVGARVEFDGVHFSLLDMQLRWDSLRVTDPKHTMSNLFETGRCELNLASAPLFSKKIIVEEMSVQDLRFNTPRKTDGALTPKERRQSEPPWLIRTVTAQLKKETANIPVFKVDRLTRKLNVDSVYSLLNLQSPRKIDSLKKVADNRFKFWEQKFAELPDQKELKSLEQQVASLNPQGIKTLAGLKQAADNARTLRKKLGTYRNTVKSIRTDFTRDLTGIRQMPATTRRWIDADYRRALQLAKLPDISVKNVARLLFGRQIVDKVRTIAGYVGMVRHYAAKYQSLTVEKKSPPRLHGQDIYFGESGALPTFWIQHAALSGEGPAALQLSGEISNLTAEQDLIGKPTTGFIGGVRQDKAALDVQGVFDYRQQTHKEEISVNFSNIPLRRVKLTRFALLPSTIARGLGFIKAELNFADSAFAAKIDFEGKQIRFAGEDSAALSPRLQRIRRQLVAAISEIRFHSQTKMSGGHLQFSINSNLDNLIAREVKKILSGEVENARVELRKRIQKETDKYQQGLQKLIDEKSKPLNTRLKQVDAQLKQHQQRVDKYKQEIENRIKKEAGNKLKNLFKRP